MLRTLHVRNVHGERFLTLEVLMPKFEKVRRAWAHIVPGSAERSFMLRRRAGNAAALAGLFALCAATAACVRTAQVTLTPPTAELGSDCQVAMQLVMTDKTTQVSVCEEAVKRNGSTAPTPVALSKAHLAVSEPKCLKYAGGRAVVPSDFRLHVESNAAGLLDSYHRICQEGKIEDQNGQYFKCSWNSNFRDQYPMSIVLYTLDGAELSRHIKLVRVFRNSTLVYRWLGTGGSVDPKVATEKVLTIPGAALRGHLMPHQAPIDIRVIDAATNVDQSELEREVSSRRSQAEESFRKVLSGAKAYVVRETELESQLMKLEENAKKLMADGKALFELNPNPADASKTCKALEAQRNANADKPSLAMLYCQLKWGAANEANTARVDIEAKIAAEIKLLNSNARIALDTFKIEVARYWRKQEEAWGPTIEQARAKGKLAVLAAAENESKFKELAGQDIPMPTAGGSFSWFKLRASGAVLEDILKSGDSIIFSALSLVDDVHVFFEQVREDVKAVVEDDHKKARLFQDIHGALSETTVFEQYAENPAPLAGETVLPMKYYDPFQIYLLAPWNGVSFRPNDGLQPEVSAMTLVPIIDGIGFRWQVGQSRFGDIRLALGVAGAMEEIEAETTAAGAGSDETKEAREVFSLIPQINVGLANFRFGLGYAAWSGEDFSAGTERLRLFIGADLFKLISGRNFEAVELGTVP